MLSFLGNQERAIVIQKIKDLIEYLFEKYILSYLSLLVFVPIIYKKRRSGVTTFLIVVKYLFVNKKRRDYIIEKYSLWYMNEQCHSDFGYQSLTCFGKTNIEENIKEWELRHKSEQI